LLSLLNKLSLETEHSHWDYIFVGLGASASTLIEVMHQRGALHEKRILALDREEKIANDKTFCFWSRDEASATHAFSDITNAHWSKIGINSKSPESIEPERYRHIRSDALYQKTRETLAQYGALVMQGQVKSIADRGEWVEVETQRAKFEAERVFDSRPPRFEMTKGTLLLWQSFLGFKVTCNREIFDPSVYTMMDFNVPQDHHTQFIYILPFSRTTALVELTRFGSEQINETTARMRLHDYLNEKFGKVEILEEEKGAIPMTNTRFQHSESNRIVKIGTSAGMIKPSTGYSFLRSFKHAEQLAANDYKPVQQPQFNRFSLYDTLLLYILYKWPHHGVQIFTALFKRISPQRVLRFLDERTTAWEDIQIFATLPPLPFLRALTHVTLRGLMCLPYAIALFAALVYLLLHAFVPAYGEWFKYGFVAIGLLAVGIPHGALDHQVKGLGQSPKDLLFFTLLYLTVMFAVFWVWKWSPALGVGSFLIYSIAHFGQTDLMQWRSKSFSWSEALLWGLTVFTVLLAPHWTEVAAILSAYQIAPLPAIPFGSELALGLLTLWAIYSVRQRVNGMRFSIVLLALTLPMDLIMAFSLYFIGQHSTTAWRHLQKELNLSSMALHLRALLYTAGAGLLLSGLYVVMGGFKDIWPVFFMFLAGISLPHTILFGVLYQRKSKSLPAH